MFAIVAVNFEAFQDLPPPEFKLMVALVRYANRVGGCCPSLTQLARDVMASVPTVSRYLDKLEDRGCFARERRPGGRYFYTLTERFRPRWPEPAMAGVKHPEKPAEPAIAAVKEGVSTVEGGISQCETQEVFLEKHSREVRESAARPPALSEGDIPDGWEEAATAERRRTGLPDVDLGREWRKHVLWFEDQGRPIRLGSWLIWAVRTRLDHTNTPIPAIAVSTQAGDAREQRQARDWVKRGFWLRDGSWGPAPNQPGCNLPAALVAWCLRERGALAA